MPARAQAQGKTKVEDKAQGMPGRARAKGTTKANANAQGTPPCMPKSLRQTRRREAVRLLNALISEVQLPAPRLPAKTTTPAQVEHVVRKLEPRCQSAHLLGRLRDATELWVDNGVCCSVPW